MIDQNTRIKIFIVISFEYSQTLVSSGVLMVIAWIFLLNIIDYESSNLEMQH